VDSKVTSPVEVTPRGAVNRAVGDPTRVRLETKRSNPPNWTNIKKISGHPVGPPGNPTGKTDRVVNQARAFKVNNNRGTHRVTKTKYPPRKKTGRNNIVG
jgi:hypothetical protein